jgi:protein-S-isoprenylcysteine O-methyltransferase Ste14
MKDRHRNLFHPASDRVQQKPVLYTLLQTAVFWTFFLVLIPAALIWLEGEIGITGFDFPAVKIPSVIIFAVAGACGIHSGTMFALYGSGTPLPLQEPHRLVFRGLYRYVRNPMAMAGILQGVMVGLFVGSWVVIAYALLGIPAWNYLARPAEEEDLAERFGEEFESYRQQVKCWVPRFTAYRPAAALQSGEQPDRDR